MVVKRRHNKLSHGRLINHKKPRYHNGHKRIICDKDYSDLNRLMEEPDISGERCNESARSIQVYTRSLRQHEQGASTVQVTQEMIPYTDKGINSRDSSAKYWQD